MIFINNKYTNWYNKIIYSAQSREYNGYTEKHHIIPKSLGGSDDKNNLVKLTPKEHYICHLLLTKMTLGLNKRKMTFALHSMLRSSNLHQRYRLTSKKYEHIRKIFAIGMSEHMSEISKTRNYRGENNPFFGKKHSDHTKKKTSGENHYTKRPDYNPQNHPSKQPGWAEANSRAKLGRKEPKYVCEYCGKTVGAKGNYVRWHGKNCRVANIEDAQ